MIAEESKSQIIDVLRSNYLETFVRRGGASVKILCGDESETQKLGQKLLEEARELHFVTALVDAAYFRVHLVQELFWGIARATPWLDIADQFARSVLDRIYFDYPDGELSIRAIADLNDIEPSQVHKRVQQELRSSVLKNPNYTRLFKSVILALVSAAFDNSGIERARGLSVIEWLKGEPGNAKILKQVNISRRINRQIARALLGDFARWIRDAGLPGLVVVADVSRYSINMGKILDRTNAYSIAASLDLCETIRQFIDGCDDNVGLLLVFLTRSEFLSDQRRGLSAYAALKMRVSDDVYDSDRPNLLAPLLVVSQ